MILSKLKWMLFLWRESDWRLRDVWSTASIAACYELACGDRVRVQNVMRRRIRLKNRSFKPTPPFQMTEQEFRDEWEKGWQGPVK